MGLPRAPHGAPRDRAEDARGRGRAAPTGLEGARLAARPVVAFVDRTDGARLAYDVAGDPRRGSLLLIGGVGGDASTWRHVVPVLAAERFVVVIDPRGVGR